MWLRANESAFDQQLGSSQVTRIVNVVITSRDGTATLAKMGYDNYRYKGGGDFGITTFAYGFDLHYVLKYAMLNNNACLHHYLYSHYQTPSQPSPSQRSSAVS